MTYAPPSRGFRTFVVIWVAQSLSVIGSGMTGLALNVYLCTSALSPKAACWEVEGRPILSPELYDELAGPGLSRGSANFPRLIWGG